MEIISAELTRRGRLNSLILSSGIYESSDDPAILRRQFEANVIGPYALIQIALPMLAQNDGHIIFMNSTQGLRASATVGQFAATMHAMKAIADALRDEVNAQGVRVTSLYLGRTAGGRQKKIFEFEGRNYPPERLMQPSDVAETVCHVLQTPRTAEITEITIRPMLKT
jgi:NADP-dependent 3-hydroxy acid dehydrogenase YdfG